MNFFRSLLLFSILLFSIDVISQPVIDKLFDYYPGFTYSYYKLQSGESIDTTLLPSYGENLFWDLDDLPWENTLYTDSIITFEQSSQQNAFSECSFVYRENSGLEQYYRKSNDTLFYMGNSSGYGQFSPNPITLIYPTTFQSSGYSFVDYQTNVPWFDVWTYSARYNAYGSLKLGGVTYTNTALYVIKGGKSGQYYIDYLWVREGDINPLVRIQFLETNSSIVVQFSYGLSSAVLAVDDLYNGDDLMVYPNPTNDQIFIKLNKDQSQIIVNQFDLNGRLVKNQEYYTVSSAVFPLEGEKGTYILEISQKNEPIKRLKVIKN